MPKVDEEKLGMPNAVRAGLVKSSVDRLWSSAGHRHVSELLRVTGVGQVSLKGWPMVVAYALRASRYDAGPVLVTALSAVFISVEFSILIGVALSILLFIPRAARLKASEPRN